jgi:hypothetical protein
MSLITKFAKAARDAAINTGDFIWTGFATHGYTQMGDGNGATQVQKALTERIRARKAARHAS